MSNGNQGTEPKSAIVLLTDANFDAGAMPSLLPGLVAVTAAWCGPCVRISRIIDDLSHVYNGRIKTVRVNCDASPRLIERFNVVGIPCVMLVKDGQMIERLLGVRPRDAYEALIDRSSAPS